MVVPIAIIPEFQYSQWLWMLTLLPLLAVTGWWLYIIRRRKLHTIFKSEYLERMLGSDFKTVGQYKTFFLMLALGFIILALANPRLPGKEKEIEHKGSDVIIALDISQSMLVKDVSPDRMSRAIKFGSELIDKLEGNRIGLIFFAGSAHTQMPLTLDYRVAKMFVQNADPAMTSHQGTAIGDAIDLGMKSFEDVEERGRAIVIVSDGEDHDAQTMDKISEAVRNNIIVLTIGVGTSRGGPVPESDIASDGYVRDENNQPVISRLNPDFLKKLAAEGRGQYFEISSDVSPSAAVAEIVTSLDKGTLTWQSLLDFESYFQYPLLLGLLMYFLFIIWPYRSTGG